MKRLVARVCGVKPLEADAALGPFLPPVVQCNVPDSQDLKVGDIVEITVRARVTAIVPKAPLPNALVQKC